MRRAVCFAFGCLLAALLSGCSLSLDLIKRTHLTRINITPGGLTLAMGQEQNYVAEGVMSDGAARDLSGKVTWSSSNPSVATFFKLGGRHILLTVGPGTTTITAVSGLISGTATLIVTTSALKTLQINATHHTIEVGQKQSFTVIGRLANGMTEDLSGGVVWSSSESAIATINNAGLATALTPGIVTITATAGGIRNTAMLTVPAPKLVWLTITPSTGSVAAGQTQQFVARGTFTDGTSQSLGDVTWSSSEPAVVSINRESGLAITQTPGVITITATAEKISSTATLTVTPPELAAIHVFSDIPFVAGHTVSLTAEGSFTDGTRLPLTSNVRWRSSDPSIVLFTGDSNTATALAGGEVTLTATSGTVSGAVTLTVTVPTLTAIHITPDAPTVITGRAQLFSAEGVFTDGTTRPLTSADLIWTSSNMSVVTIENNSGLATMLTAGEATIIADSGNISGTTHLTVTPPELKEIRVLPDKTAVAAGRTISFTTEGSFTDGTIHPLTSDITWTSSHPLWLTIDKDGLATAIAIGVDHALDIIIIADSGNISGTAHLTITPPELSSLRVFPDETSVAAGLAQQFYLEGSFSDGTTGPLGSEIVWVSSEPSVATIDSRTGLANTLIQGVIVVTAIADKISGTTHLTVTPSELTGIRVTPNNSSVVSGETQQFVAAGTYTDGTDRPLTTEVTWDSSDPSVATINAEGLATTASQGVDSPLTIRILVAHGKWVGTTNLTVWPTHPQIRD
ncbi:MAG: Ig-like domain-containing protein [Nitrospirae bacterium]|nr:Ig-like domain-containing protein [Candidatus Troglogloeales bacterium]